MAQTVGSLLIRVGASITDLQKNLERAERRLNRSANRFNSIGQNLTMSVSLPLAAIGGGALKAAANFEQLRTSFQVLTKSVEKGNKFFDELVTFTEKTPFELEQVAQAAKTMLGFGYSTAEVNDSLQYLGDIAAATGANISEMAVIMGEAKATGLFMTKDLRQLANKGVPVLDLLAKELGVAKGAILDLASEGKISFAAVESALKKQTQAGGLYANSMEKQSKTLAGLFSTLKDTATTAMAELGMSIKETFELDVVVERMTKKVKAAVEWFKGLSDTQKKLVITVAAVAAAMGPLALAVGQVYKMLALVRGAAALGVGPIAKIAKAFKEAYGEAKSLKGVLKMMGLAMMKTIAIVGAVVAVIAVLAIVANAVYQNWDELKNRWHNIWASIMNFTAKFIKGTLSAIDDFVNAASFGKVQTNLAKSFDFTPIEKVATKPMMGFIDATKAGLDDLKQWFYGTKKTAEETTVSMSDGFEEVETAIEATGEAAKKTFEALKPIGDFFDRPTLGQLDTGALEKIGQRFSPINAEAQERAKAQVTGMAKGIDELIPKIKEAQGASASWYDRISKLADQIGEGMAKVWEKVGPAFNGFMNLMDAAFAKQQASIDETYERQMRYIESSRMSEENKQKAIQRLEEETDKKRRKLARAQAIREKALSVAQATIGIAQAIINALKAGPVAGPILAGVIGALGAAQLAVIASTPIPALAKGGLAYGPSMAMVGDNPGARVDPEVIAPLSRLRDIMGGVQNVVVTGRIDGRDILLVQERAANDRLRTRGF